MATTQAWEGGRRAGHEEIDLLVAHSPEWQDTHTQTNRQTQTDRQTDAHAHIHTHTQTHTHTHIHTQTQTHTHTHFLHTHTFSRTASEAPHKNAGAPKTSDLGGGVLLWVDEILIWAHSQTGNRASKTRRHLQ